MSLSRGVIDLQFKAAAGNHTYDPLARLLISGETLATEVAPGTDRDASCLTDQVSDRTLAARTTATAAALVNAGLTATPTQLCTALLTAAHHLDGAEIVAVLGRSVWLHGTPRTIDDVMMPALREIGNRWSRGECDVAQEHLATATIQDWLHTQSEAARPPEHAPVVVLGAGPLEQHTLGLSALAVLLAHHGVAFVNLGARTPADALRTAIKHADAAAVVLTAQLKTNRPETIAALRAVTDTGAALYYAGAAFRTFATRRGVPGTYLGGSLTKAAAGLATLEPRSGSVSR